MADADVLAQQHGAVRVLTLNRPHRLNAWTVAMGDRYFDLLDDADADPGVRAVVVTGAGRGFCPGVDADDLANAAAGKGLLPAKGRRMTHARAFRKPLIGAINGACAGFGFVQALHFDLRFASEDAVFTTAFVRRGLNAEYGASWLLPRIVGQGRAMDLILSGRRVGAHEAERMGLVNAVLAPQDLLAHAISYADEIATWCSPVAVADSKWQVLHDWQVDCSAAEDRAKAISHTPGHRVDFEEGIASFVGKRAPCFAALAPLRAKEQAG